MDLGKHYKGLQLPHNIHKMAVIDVDTSFKKQLRVDDMCDKNGNNLGSIIDWRLGEAFSSLKWRALI